MCTAHILRSPSTHVTLQAAAGMGVFGPRTIYCIALKDAPGCQEFLLQDDGKWVHVKETTEIGESLGLLKTYSWAGLPGRLLTVRFKQASTPPGLPQPAVAMASNRMLTCTLGLLSRVGMAVRTI